MKPRSHFDGLVAEYQPMVARICASYERLPPAAALSESIPDAQPAPESAAIANNERSGLLAAVQRLPLVYRQPVILTLEDFSPADI